MEKLSNILYQLSNNLDNESIDTNDKYLNEIMKNVEKYYLLPATRKDMIVKGQSFLGNIAFYLLNTPNLNIDKDTQNKIQLINSYLSSCLADSKYCNTKIFLSFARDILKIQRFPKGEIFTSDYYKDSDNIENTSLNEKLTIFFNNSNEIKLNKSYECNGIIDLIVASIMEIFLQGYSIKKCRNCHKYFYNKNSNMYCPYASPQNINLSCYTYSTNTSYVEKRKNDPIREKYNKISNMLRSRYRYYDDDSDLDTLNDFASNYHFKMELLNEGKITKEEMLEFLEVSDSNFRNNYVRRRNNGGKRT